MDIGGPLVRGLLRFGVGGPLLRNSGGAIEARNAGNTDYVIFRALGINTGGSTRYVSTTPPNAPLVGDEWKEIDGTGKRVWGWDWEWNGTYWLSDRRTLDAAYNPINSTLNIEKSCNQNLDYFIENIRASGVVVSPNDGTNNWSFQMQRVSSAGAVATVGASLVSSATGTASFALQTALNTHVDVSAVSARRFQLTAQKNANAGNFVGNIEIDFRYARP